MRLMETVCAIEGGDVPSATRPLTAPIYQNSVFDIKSLERIDDIVADIEQALARA